MPQQFVIPQFIETEAKIFLGMSGRQFILVVVGGLIIALAYRFADFSLFVILAVLDIFIFGAFAFIRINGQPFHFFILNIIQTMRKPRVRVWDKGLTREEIRFFAKGAELPMPTKLALKKPLRVSRLSELALVVDTGGVYRGEGV